MPSRARVDFRGRQLIETVRAAAIAGVNETVKAARDEARETHTWKPDVRLRKFEKGVKDTDLERQIVSKNARRASLKVGGPDPSGSFGYTKRKGFYGLFHEEGTVHEHMYPALRPAADRIFPTLARRIRAHLGITAGGNDPAGYRHYDEEG